MTSFDLQPITSLPLTTLDSNADIKQVIEAYNNLAMLVNSSLIRQCNDTIRKINNA